MSNAVVTFALGKDYQEYAVSLAYSFLTFNTDNDIYFYIVSNESFPIPRELASRVRCIRIKSLYLDKEVLLNKIFVLDYVQADNILLIDADSFICSDLKPLFHLYRNDDIVIWGEKITDKDKWRGNVEQILKANNINFLYRLNGGLYYFHRGEKSLAFFDLCKDLIENYEKQKFDTVYDSLKDDEIIFSTACVKLDIVAKKYDGSIKAETMYFSKRYINLFVGNVKLSYNNYEVNTTNMLMHRKVYPLIVCFDRNSVRDLDYRINAFLIRHFLKSNIFFKVIMSFLVSSILFIYYFFKQVKKNLSYFKHTKTI